MVAKSARCASKAISGRSTTPNHGSTPPRTYDLAPNLKRADVNIIDGATLRPVQWFFDNLLPEKDARETLSTEAKF